MRAPKGATPGTVGASPPGQVAERAADELDASGAAVVGEEAPTTEEKGESGRTNRDMQAVTDHYDERPTIDIRRIEKVSR